MTKYQVYRFDDPGTLKYLGESEARSAKAAVAALVTEPGTEVKYAAIPTRNVTVLTAKTKPAQVSWS